MKRCLAIGLIWSFAILGIANTISLFRKPTCRDCAFPRGVPFIAYYDPTFNSFDGKGFIVWTGVIANVAFATFSGAFLASLIHATRVDRSKT